MKKFKLSILAITITLAFNMNASAESMSKNQYEATVKKINAEHKAAKLSCDAFSGNANDICMAEAKGKSNVAEANLEATYQPSADNRYKAHVAKADADYALAEQKCDDKAGNNKDVCLKEAKAVNTRLISDAKLEKQSRKANAEANEKSMDAKDEAILITNDANADAMETKSDARKDAAMQKRDADYAVAKEKCDVLAGSAKDKCIDTAKIKFGL
ncbi:hypothetical protein [Methylotenera sp.]|uniref:hypothetical protein n=1 Tax=Methylotenera sp. TaxID=2051956 RepID=UPI002EDAB8DF